MVFFSTLPMLLIILLWSQKYWFWKVVEMLANISHVRMARVLNNIHHISATVPKLLSMELIVAKVSCTFSLWYLIYYEVLYVFSHCVRNLHNTFMVGECIRFLFSRCSDASLKVFSVWKLLYCWRHNSAAFILWRNLKCNNFTRACFFEPEYELYTQQIAASECSFTTILLPYIPLTKNTVKTLFARIWIARIWIVYPTNTIHIARIWIVYPTNRNEWVQLHNDFIAIYPFNEKYSKNSHFSDSIKLGAIFSIMSAKTPARKTLRSRPINFFGGGGAGIVMCTIFFPIPSPCTIFFATLFRSIFFSIAYTI
jgi:hypothetical protein